MDMFVQDRKASVLRLSGHSARAVKLFGVNDLYEARVLRAIDLYQAFGTILYICYTWMDGYEAQRRLRARLKFSLYI